MIPSRRATRPRPVYRTSRPSMPRPSGKRRGEYLNRSKQSAIQPGPLPINTLTGGGAHLSRWKTWRCVPASPKSVALRRATRISTEPPAVKKCVNKWVSTDRNSALKHYSAEWDSLTSPSGSFWQPALAMSAQGSLRRFNASLMLKALPAVTRGNSFQSIGRETGAPGRARTE
jgi:hypothetical protein